MKRASAEATPRLASSSTRRRRRSRDFGAKLLASVQALQAAGTGPRRHRRARRRGDRRPRSQYPGAGRDRRGNHRDSEQAAVERLAAIQKNEADVNAEIETAVAARAEGARGQSRRATRIARRRSLPRSAQIRLTGLSKTLADYQAFLASQVALQQQRHVANINNLEQQRLAFNDGVEKQLFAIRLVRAIGIRPVRREGQRGRADYRVGAQARREGADPTRDGDLEQGDRAGVRTARS